MPLAPCPSGLPRFATWNLAHDTSVAHAIRYRTQTQPTPCTDCQGFHLTPGDNQ